ncbi:hypothetical protein HanPSC8_Chr08g0318551 [Helianthus annuus]|nr:hypothetical protein HanPSC8_Chr08g0318551 [Helianthus annuus]
MDSDKLSVHRQFPLYTDALPVLVTVLSVSTDMRDNVSLSHPAGVERPEELEDWRT